MLEDKEVQLRRVTNVLVQFGVDKVDKQGVREEDGRQVVRVVGVEVWTVG